MKTPQRARWFTKDWIFAALAFLTMVSFVPAESIYEALASNPQFLAVRQVGNVRLVEIVFAFNVLPTLALFLLWGLCRLLHRTLARAFLAVVCGLFLLAFGLQVHNLYLSKSEFLTQLYAMWLIPAILAGYASWRFEKPFRSFVMALSPGIVLFPAFFLFRTWKPAVKSEPPSELAKPQILKTGHAKFPPVFLIIFDEFRFHDLLGTNGEINGELFPNFQKLAEDSTWFRNATANADSTALSIPVILTGNFPTGIDPSYKAYPHNLLTLLQPYYNIYVREVETHFCIEGRYHCPDAEIESSDLEILHDLLIIYAARVLPKNDITGLPSLARSWGPFRNSAEEMAARIARFRAFLNSLSAIPGDRTFVMLHQQLPHSPYALTSDGMIYNADPNYVDSAFVGNVALLDSLHKRYVMQIGYVDKELGQFISRMKQLGLYDESLIIITADHGVSFLPAAPGRDVSPANADELLPVPLFIKAPFQKDGVASDRDVQLIDVLPTVADLLGLKVPWAVAGHSIFELRPKPRMKIAFPGDMFGLQLAFPPTLAVSQENTPPPVEKSPLLGRNVSTCDVIEDLDILGWLGPMPFSIFETRQGLKETSVNVYGWAAHADSNDIPRIAVAVNGEIVAVTSPCCERRDVAAIYHGPQFLRSGWRTSFSSRKLHAGVNTVSAYVVLDEKDRSLALLNSSMPDIIHGVRPSLGQAKAAPGLVGSQAKSCVIEHSDSVNGYLDFISQPTVHMRPGVDDFPIDVGGWAVRPGIPAKNVEVALALNGEIVAVTSVCCRRPDVEQVLHDPSSLESGWTTSLQSLKLRNGKNEVAAYVVLDAGKKRLVPLHAVKSVIQVKFD
jgi:Sulfatase